MLQAKGHVFDGGIAYARMNDDGEIMNIFYQGKVYPDTDALQYVDVDLSTEIEQWASAYKEVLDICEKEVYYIDPKEEKIHRENLLNLLQDYREESTTPEGVGPTYFVENFTLYRWSVDGKKLIVSQHNSEAEAVLELLHTYEYDLQAAEVEVFDTLEEAYEWKEGCQHN